MAERDSLSPVAVGTLSAAALLLYFWLSDAIFPADTSGFAMSSLQVTGMALTYSATPAFLLSSQIYARRRTRAILDELVDSLTVNPEAANACASSGSSLGLAVNVAATIVGLLLGSTQVAWQPFIDSIGSPRMLIGLSLAVGNLVTWLVVVHVIVRRVLALIAVRRLGREHTKVDLLRLDAQLPFGRIGTFHVLIATLSVSFSVFQSIDAEFRWVNYSAALAAAVPAGLVLLVLPMIGVRQTVRREKHRALEELDIAIAHADRALEPEPLRYLGDLLQQREAVGRAREWPLDTTAFSRIAVYFIIPPLAWLGSALVEIFLELALVKGP